MHKVVVVPDSFKGTMSSREICAIWEQAILNKFPACKVFSIPVADGGEGTVDCFRAFAGGRMVEAEVHDPFFQKITGRYLTLPDGKTAVIEVAAAIGLPLVEGREDPLKASSFGVGELLAHARRSGCTEFIIGLGGSCTNDAGAGMAAALGAKFTDGDGREFIPCGGDLNRVSGINIQALRALFSGCKVTAMCDVDNPLYGEGGAARMFGPQKGAKKSTVETLDRNLKIFAQAVRGSLGIDVSLLKGGGAAGGIGAGIFAFLGGRLTSGIDVVLDSVCFEEIISDADLIITGEGRIDEQSLRGKVVAGVAKRAQSSGKPVVAVVGDIEPGAQAAYDYGVTAIFSINKKAVPFETARRTSPEDLAFTADSILRLIQNFESRR